MGETKHYAYECHCSLDDHFLATFTNELLAYLRDYFIWYALKHEVGENGKLHVHFACVKEMAKADSEEERCPGGITKWNLKQQMLTRCPQLAAYIAAMNTQKFWQVFAPLKSDVFIVSYMQKEGDLVYHRLPKDHLELVPYFSELQKKKKLNTDYETWVADYENDLRFPKPATFESVWNFFQQKFLDNEYKILADKKRLEERCDEVLRQLTGTFVPVPAKRRRTGASDKDSSIGDGCRFCPRCPEPGTPLAPREQFCQNCKRY